MDDDRVLEQAEAWLAEGRMVALATVLTGGHLDGYRTGWLGLWPS